MRAHQYNVRGLRKDFVTPRTNCGASLSAWVGNFFRNVSLLSSHLNSFPRCRNTKNLSPNLHPLPSYCPDVHRSIKLCPITKLVMSTPQMQRLKGLKQLGCTDQTYMCATHTRFEHSIGVAGLAEQLLEEIRERQPKLNIT